MLPRAKEVACKYLYRSDDELSDSGNVYSHQILKLLTFAKRKKNVVQVTLQTYFSRADNHYALRPQ